MSTPLDTGVIRTARDLVERIADGWELWHLGDRKLGLPGWWQLRHRHRTRPVEWAAIEQLRRSARLIRWMDDNTECIEIVPARIGWPNSGDECYRRRQAGLAMGEQSS